ncbi:group II truncated hemoglobin [soil metagenome]
MTPFELLGGAEQIRGLVERFYEVMYETEPQLAQLHRTEPDGRVEAGSRQRFALFVMGWLGGPQDYTEQHGHPRLRMRHGRVAVDAAMRDAWLRCMQTAMNERQIAGPVRTYLDGRFAEVADFMRNTGT